jgi:ATP-dependent helicase/nuclease subunit B
LPEHIHVAQVRPDQDHTLARLQGLIQVFPTLYLHYLLDLIDRKPTEPEKIIVALADIHGRLAHQGSHLCLASLGALDEHGWAARVAGGEVPSRHRQIVITVADQAADPSGLWPCDFDVLARLPGLDRIDVVVTEAVLGTGLHERLHERFPGIEECHAGGLDTGRPVLVVPPREDERLYFVSRDREDEMAAAARRLVGTTRDPASAAASLPALDTLALVFQRPLPYLYVGRQLLEAEGVPCEAADELPLAAEPAAAALDVVLTFATSGYTRAAILALLRSPHLRIEVGGRAPSAFDVAQFDERARESGYIGGRDRLDHLAARLEAEGATHPRAAAAARAARAAATAASALPPGETLDRASAWLDGLIAFLDAHERATPAAASWAERERRARWAIRDVLRGLRDACRRHGDRETTLVELSSEIRHWIETHTFAPRTGDGGLQLVDELAARYGHFAHVHLLGLVEGEWPRASARNVFFPAVLLRDLGWPKDEDRQAAARAYFVDLLALASEDVSVSAFSLEDDALVRPSVLVEELEQAGLERRTWDPASAGPRHGTATRANPDADQWRALRASRAGADGPEFHGQAGPTEVARHSVTGIETYLDCPFRYFARKVLRLEEERPDEAGLDPLRRGRFVHAAFERFFDEWTRDGHRAMTPELVPTARTRFAALVEEMLESLPPADRAVERVRLLGSPAVAGFGERAFRLEADRPTPVLARRMEVKFDDEYEFAAGDRSCRIRLRGVADRVDLLADGTLRIIDYKSGAAPSAKRAVQLPVYGVCAERAFAGELGRTWQVGEAAYLAFGDRRAYVPVIASAEDRAAAMDAAIGRLVDAVEAIGRGEFPPRPAEWSLCNSCAFAAICRKDYVVAD